MVQMALIWIPLQELYTCREEGEGEGARMRKGVVEARRRGAYGEG